ncbi:NAD-dependent protein deacylase [Rhodococcus sp. RD6.2]|jgi:NAD-dependent deacetylase|uniref:SIR2 family NAD-dependent protein deacylase n=1 Tax=Rhodococcus sp. RD6.2 TaxID=260936 RepID=UPI00063BC3A2|nr:NAD-dependent deacylase [Rhodococcus sp. RD6.2]CRK49889.1 NAD-dependent protein deacylase [Rhodococcus sp. RD6.2]
MALIQPDPALLDVVRSVERVTVFSGAGMSAESGVPTFRDALTGLWERFDPTELATPQAWEKDPALVWAWYEWRAALVRRVQPNAGHRAVAEWADTAEVTVLTQNVDDLHERAGSTVAAHLHGSLYAPRCCLCGLAADLDDARFADLRDEPAERITPPSCESCTAPVRPGAVWFGEELPADAWQASVDAVEHCDLMLVVGTSAVVYPAAELPLRALRAGATVVEINPEPTDLSSAVTHSWRATAAQALPVLAAVGQGRSPRM